MKTSTYFFISGQIILIFLVMGAATLLPDLFPKLFGDWHCQGRICTQNAKGYCDYLGCDYANQGAHNPDWHWGYRHWLFFFMGLILFIIQTIRLISYTNKKIDEKS